MARYAEMSGQTCTNVALADQATATQRGWLGPIPAQVGPGWTTTDGGQTWTSGTLPVPPEQANQQTVADQLRQALNALQSIVDAAAPPAGTLTTAQLSNAVRALDASVKTMARAERRLIRNAVQDYTASD